MLTLRREEEDGGDREYLRSGLLDRVLERGEEADDGDSESRFEAVFFSRHFF